MSRAVPPGLESIRIAAHPTLKRGANKRCASGATMVRIPRAQALRFRMNLNLPGKNNTPLKNEERSVLEARNINAVVFFGFAERERLVP